MVKPTIAENPISDDLMLLCCYGMLSVVLFVTYYFSVTANYLPTMPIICTIQFTSAPSGRLQTGHQQKLYHVTNVVL
jgi:hypothetical protein